MQDYGSNKFSGMDRINRVLDVLSKLDRPFESHELLLMREQLRNLEDALNVISKSTSVLHAITTANHALVKFREWK